MATLQAAESRCQPIQSPMSLGRQRPTRDGAVTLRGGHDQVEGFKREGLLREHETTHKGLCDMALYGLLRREWRAA